MVSLIFQILVTAWKYQGVWCGPKQVLGNVHDGMHGFLDVGGKSSKSMALHVSGAESVSRGGRAEVNGFLLMHDSDSALQITASHVRGAGFNSSLTHRGALAQATELAASGFLFKRESSVDMEAAALNSFCGQPWMEVPKGSGNYDRTIPCPHGKVLPGSVTLPQDATVFELICVFYGYVPFIVGILALFEIGFVTIRQKMKLGTRECSFVGFVSGSCLLNELILKRIVKNSRPELSCNFSCGMPSGHSTVAMCLWTLALLDSYARMVPNNMRGPDLKPLKLPSSHPHRKNIGVGHRLVSSVPLPRLFMLTQMQFVVFMLVWSVLLLPVPYSRTVLYDHYPSQVVVGSICGIIEAIIFWFAVRLKQQEHWKQRMDHDNIATGMGGYFLHNHPLPFEDDFEKVRLSIQNGQAESVADADEGAGSAGGVNSASKSEA